MSLYCYQCGEKLIEGAKFCHVCGADQSVVEKLYESTPKIKDDDWPNDPPSKEDTKIFYLGGQSEEKDLNRYLSEVDKQIKENIEAFEEKNSSPPGPSKKEDRVEEAKKIEPAPKKKKTFKEIWRDFIDEEDNPYSVFGELTKDDDLLQANKEDKILLSNEVKNDGISSTESSSETGDYKGLSQKVNEILEEEASLSKGKSFSLGEIFSAFFPSSKNQKRPAEKQAESPSSADLDDPLITDLRLEEALKSKQEDGQGHFVATLKEVDQAPKKTGFSQEARKSPPEEGEEDGIEATSFSLVTSDQQDKKKEGPKKKKERSFLNLSSFFKKRPGKSEPLAGSREVNDLKPSSLIQEPTPEVAGKKISPFLHRLCLAYSRLGKKIVQLGLPGLVLIFLLGLVFATAPIYIIQRDLGLAEVIFSIIKLSIGLFAFYFANRIARTNTVSNFSIQALTLDTVLHWALCQVFLFLAFFLYPKTWVMGHDLLGALTPHIFTSIFYYLLALFLSFVSVFQRLAEKKYLEYFGWFSIVFILVELFSKLFWVIITFLSTSIL